ncbi:hypothetical protein [Azohydromonas lata]|uniref:hypothetical protein n=1 Tax=Azohydromonas lata TaxID=45677 RepID=UPI0012F52070|nr:hypothetical protein [Azohydromonas lata]
MISLKLRRPRRAAVEPEALAGRAWKDGDTLPFVHRHAVTIPLSQIPTRPRTRTVPPQQHPRAAASRPDNATGDPWVPPGAYGAAAAQVEGGEAPAPAPMFRAGGGGEFSGGGADASWKTDGDSGSSSSDSGSDSGGSD